MTLNNWTQIEHTELLLADVTYSIIGRETGEAGTPHLQGYFYFKNQRNLSTLKKLNERAHWEIALGSTEQNIAYCSKEDPYPETTGKPPLNQKQKGEANKTRWDEARAAAKAGDMDSIPSDIFMQYYRTCKEIAKDHMIKPEDADGVTGVWLYGPAGAGKSRKAREDYPGSYLKMANKWWDGYQGETTVILDDLDKKHDVLGHHLKIWSDRYSFLAETKGGAIHIRPSLLCVTSQYHPDDIWEDAETRAAIMRRFKVVRVGGYKIILGEK